MKLKKYSKELIGSSLAIAGIFIALVNPIANATPTSISRISVDSSGTQSNDSSTVDDISADGRYVVFESLASNLVSGDTNGVKDVFVRDTTNGTTERVSISNSGAQGSYQSYGGRISGDGRYVVFTSMAGFASSENNGTGTDIFLRDRTNNTTSTISLNSSGSGTANSGSFNTDVSDDGRFVVFTSSATDIVSGDTNGENDIFLKDLQANTVKRINVSSSGTQSNNNTDNARISCDGRYVVFSSYASNLVSGDTNGVMDSFLYDSIGSILSNISINGNGQTTVDDVSCDAKYITTTSYATNLVSGDTNSKADILLYTKSTNSYSRVSIADDESQSNDYSSMSTISSDGKRVAFTSVASNLISGDTNAKYDIFVRDLTAGTTTRFSESASAAQSDDYSYRPLISPDGKYLAFYSGATNLVSGDTNAKSDIFFADTGATANSCN